MNKFLLLISVVFLCVPCVFSQVNNTPKDSIVIKQNFFGISYIQGGKKISEGELKKKFKKENSQAFKEMKKARTMKTVGTITGLLGIILVTKPFEGTDIRDVNWVVVAIGGVSIAATIQLMNGYEKHAINAVKIYNSGIRSEL